MFCEVGKQVSSYSVQYYNGGTYPVPQTMLVLLGEIIKLFTTLARTGCAPPSIDFISLRQSVKFLIPSIFYAVNNNIYFIGLMYVPPPIWIILCSFRTVITATVYKVRYGMKEVEIFHNIVRVCPSYDCSDNIQMNIYC